MTINEAIAVLEAEISDPNNGLPFEVFQFISRLTPLVNIDLLIKDENNRLLLAWRDDQFAGQGWHIPGGIVRYKEDLETRIQKTAQREIGSHIQFNPEPIAMNQIICKHETRGHFISLLYECSLSSDFIPANDKLSAHDIGYLAWHDSCPENLIKSHEMYRKFLK